MVQIVGAEVVVKICLTNRGYVVSVWDIDSGLQFPELRIDPDFARAIRYAVKCLDS